jgi:hypothetical protein
VSQTLFHFDPTRAQCFLHLHAEVFFTGDGGGIWASLNGSALKQVFFEPVIDLLVVDTAKCTSHPAACAALLRTSNSVFVSTDLFVTWRAASASPLPWSFGNLPFILFVNGCDFRCSCLFGCGRTDCCRRQRVMSYIQRPVLCRRRIIICEFELQHGI